MINLQQIDEQTINEAFVSTIAYFSSIEKIDMQRMKLQIEWARKIIDAWASGYQHCIVSAPTGFGKSLLAFFLSKFFSELERLLEEDEDTLMPAYALTSNKFLQSQYQRDLEDFAMLDWTAMLKGQANYSCSVNPELNFSTRPCSEESISNLESAKTKWQCAKDCKYIVSRRKAIQSDLTIFNYAYWLTSMNLANTIPNYPFQMRDLTIFDECHVLGQIVQDMFSVEFNTNQYIRRMLAADMAISNRMQQRSNMIFSDFTKLVGIVDGLKRAGDRFDEAYQIYTNMLLELIAFRNAYASKVIDLIKFLPKNDAGETIKTKEDTVMIDFAKTLANQCQQLLQLKDIYYQLGSETMVVSWSENATKKFAPIEQFGDITNWSIKFQCTNESELVKMSVLRNCNYGLFMSATIGNVKDYAAQTGIENYVGFEVPQVFDYAESPIFYVQPLISMNWKNKLENMPKLIQRIIMCIEAHPHDRGVVHTGNFEIMRELEKLNHPRIITYSNSAEKEDILRLLKSSDNAVICGPSLIEGVDLKDDLARFMIFAKVPFMSLADQLTKRKMQIYKQWYNWVTLSQILQGLGRGIRNDKDWCKTYILDASFLDFFRRYPPPSWVQSRISDTKYSSIGIPHNAEAEADAEFQKMLNGMM